MKQITAETLLNLNPDKPGALRYVGLGSREGVTLLFSTEAPKPIALFIRETGQGNSSQVKILRWDVSPDQNPPFSYNHEAVAAARQDLTAKNVRFGVILEGALSEIYLKATGEVIARRGKDEEFAIVVPVRGASRQYVPPQHGDYSCT